MTKTTDQQRYFNLTAIDYKGSPRTAQIWADDFKIAAEILHQWYRIGATTLLGRFDQQPIIAGYIFDTQLGILTQFVAVGDELVQR